MGAEQSSSKEETEVDWQELLDRQPQALELQDRRLARVPNCIGQLTSLRSLGLQCNELTSLPSSLSALVGLRELRLYSNGLESLPLEFGSLRSLQELWLSDNALVRLPDSFGSLCSLQYLRLDNNRLPELPETFGQLSALRYLRLDRNHLESLPRSFGRLTQLQDLGLDHNRLDELPESVRRLRESQGLVVRRTTAGNRSKTAEAAEAAALLKVGLDSPDRSGALPVAGDTSDVARELRFLHQNVDGPRMDQLILKEIGDAICNSARPHVVADDVKQPDAAAITWMGSDEPFLSMQMRLHGVSVEAKAGSRFPGSCRPPCQVNSRPPGYQQTVQITI